MPKTYTLDSDKIKLFETKTVDDLSQGIHMVFPWWSIPKDLNERIDLKELSYLQARKLYFEENINKKYNSI